MTHNDDLHLNRFAAYIRREAALKWAAWGLIAGLGIAALLAVFAWTVPILSARPRAALSLGLPALVTLIAFIVAYLYPRSSMAIARESDTRMRLRARLATALEIRAGQLPVPFEIAARQWADAHAAAEGADPGQAFKPRIPRRQALIATALCAVLLAGFILPNPQEARIAQRQAEREAVAEQVERLNELRAEIAADPELSEEDRDLLLRELDEALRDLREGELSKEEAVARLAETEDKLQELLDENAQSLDTALREAGRQAAQGEATEVLGQALVQGEYADAAQALRSLGEGLSSDLADAQDLAERLEAMASALAQERPELAQALRDAAEAMRAGDVEAAQGALGRAAEQMREAGQQIAAGEAAGRALGQLQEARRGIAQSGQGGQGTASQGQGRQGQSGQGQSAGQGGSGSGHGDAGKAASSGTPSSPGGPIPPNQPGQEGQTAYEPVYAPERLGGEGGEAVALPGQGEGTSPTEESGSHPPQGSPSLVPYDQVYAEYSRQAARALENSYIPRGLKEYVRAYFSSLEPE